MRGQEHRTRIEQYLAEGRTVSGGDGNPPDKRLKVSFTLPNDASTHSTTVSKPTWDDAAAAVLADNPTATVTKIELDDEQ